MPYRLTRPYVGLSPTVPVSDAGCRMEPPVSVPRAKYAWPPATAAAEPPDEPPGTVDSSHGLRTGPNAEFSLDDPMANSSQFVFPSRIAPAASRRSCAADAYGDRYPSRMKLPAVVGSPPGRSSPS